MRHERYLREKIQARNVRAEVETLAALLVRRKEVRGRPPWE